MLDLKIIRRLFKVISYFFLAPSIAKVSILFSPFKIQVTSIESFNYPFPCNHEDIEPLNQLANKSSPHTRLPALHFPFYMSHLSKRRILLMTSDNEASKSTKWHKIVFTTARKSDENRSHKLSTPKICHSPVMRMPHSHLLRSFYWSESCDKQFAKNIFSSLIPKIYVSIYLLCDREKKGAINSPAEFVSGKINNSSSRSFCACCVSLENWISLRFSYQLCSFASGFAYQFRRNVLNSTKNVNFSTKARDILKQ